ncbi:LysR substrate-binding domain-containing protein [Microvirga rosea]|uniref:LysR substrate-binding domain-containing protein n=1 Tax=Microvirga rosea TaxID=2715425 RepID=UPI001D0A6929|nr:LysR substrate-binding domain-containing protein [Microvirga rosea]MCB8822259.1 LysR family transcriptional regulator [Microvirga rosea]
MDRPTLFPSLTGLRSFEAAVRHGSMTKAAAELDVTQGAVSRAIRALQAELGFPLLAKTKPALELTPLGEAVFAELHYSFDRIKKLMERLKAEEDSRALRIDVLPTFGLRLLIPRLPSFKAQYPDMQIDVVVGEGPIDFSNDQVDVGIRYGKGDWARTKSYRILDEELIVVCAPSLLNEGEIDPTQLRSDQMIRHTTRLEAWGEWFESLHLPSRQASGLGFEHFFMVIEAAVVGIGYALLPRFLIREELAKGTLVIASPHTLRRQQGYFLMCSPERQADPRVLAFRRWLHLELQNEPF